MKGVKIVALTSVVNTPMDKAEDAFKKGNERYERKEFAEAASLFQESAEMGYAPAQFNLGNMCAKGEGVERDEVKAVEWYQKAAEQGNAQAQCNLGVMCAKGEGVAKNETKAVEWFRKAAEQGDAQAQNNLGSRYSEGRGVAKDEVNAVEWYRQAAEQGDAEAQNNLGAMYATSRNPGLRKPKDALEYARKAKSQLPDEWHVNDTLAAALAADGQFQQAIEAQEKAISLLRDIKAMPGEEKQKRIQDAEKRLDLYRRGLPFIQEE